MGTSTIVKRTAGIAATVKNGSESSRDKSKRNRNLRCRRFNGLRRAPDLNPRRRRGLPSREASLSSSIASGRHALRVQIASSNTARVRLPRRRVGRLPADRPVAALPGRPEEAAELPGHIGRGSLDGPTRSVEAQPHGWSPRRFSLDLMVRTLDGRMAPSSGPSQILSICHSLVQ